MKSYKSSQQKARPMNTCAPSELIDNFLLVATDLNMGETLSEAIQLMMKFTVSNKNNDKFKQAMKELK